MPRGDRTGPAGMGPLTGRGAGFCAGYDGPGFARDTPRGAGPGANDGVGFGAGRGRGAGRGKGAGQGRGAGRGFRHRFYATGVPGWAALAGSPADAAPDPAQEANALRQQAEALSAQLAAIRERLDGLDAPESQ